MIRDILLAHFAAYPLMGPQDAVKLLYQMEYGPEHMIRDEEKSLAALRKEMAALPAREGEEPLYESIGNGLCRLNLRPCVQRAIPAEDVNRLFADTARSAQGDPRRFRRALKELKELADAGETPFDPVELDMFLMQYWERNCPAVHHSEAYRAAYAPAYRVAAQKKVKDYLAARRREKEAPFGE